MHTRLKRLQNLLLLVIFVTTLSSHANPQQIKLEDYKIGVTTGSGSYELLAKQGYQFVESSTGRLFQLKLDDEKFLSYAKKLSEKGIFTPVTNGFLSIKVVGPEKDQPAALDYCKKVFARAKHLGVKKIVFGSQGSRTPPKGYPAEQTYADFVAFLKILIPEAKKHNLIISLEPLTNDPLMPTIASAARMCKDVNEPDHLGITADFWHMMNNNDAPENIVKYAKHIKHIHLAEKEGRTPPGISNQDLSPYWEAMVKSGYTGLVSIEAGWPKNANHKTHGPTALKLIKQGIQKALQKTASTTTKANTISPTGYSNHPTGTLEKPLLYSTYAPSLKLPDNVLVNYSSAAPAAKYSPKHGKDSKGTREPIHGLASALAVNHGNALSYVWDKTECRLLYAWKDGFLDMTPYWGTEEKGNRKGFGYIPKLEGSLTYLANGSHPLSVNKAPIGKPQYHGYDLKSNIPTFRWSTQGVAITTTILPAENGHISIKYSAPENATLTYKTSKSVSSIKSISPHELVVTIPTDDIKKIPTDDIKKFTKISTEWGDHLYTSFGCNTCHSVDGSKSHGPTFHALAGSKRKFAETEVTADSAYLYQSIKDPNAKIVPGFLPNYMPKYTLSDKQIQSLVLYIESLSSDQ